MINMRKWLIRMSQTAMVVGGSSTLYGPAIDILLGRHQEPNPTYFHSGTWKLCTVLGAIQDSESQDKPMAV